MSEPHHAAAAREFPRALRLAIVWLVIGTVVFLAVQALQAHAERARFSFDAASGRIELKRAADGHFHWPGRVNGVAVTFLVDTGATSTTLPLALAQQAGLALEGSIRSSTAGGEVQGRLARADVALQGGVVAERLRVAVLPQLEAPLLGMDVISKLRLSQAGGVLTLELAR
jgi:aspartyl protease family protein